MYLNVAFQMQFSDMPAMLQVSAEDTAHNTLSPKAQDAWNQCFKREFDFGYDSGFELWAFTSNISHESISKITGTGGSIVTKYSITEIDT